MPIAFQGGPPLTVMSLVSLPVGERSLIVLEVELRSGLRDRHRLTRPGTGQRLRLATIGAGKIGSGTLLGLRRTRKGRCPERDDESETD
jgi:hypothetical protein